MWISESTNVWERPTSPNHTTKNNHYVYPQEVGVIIVSLIIVTKRIGVKLTLETLKTNTTRLTLLNKKIENRKHFGLHDTNKTDTIRHDTKITNFISYFILIL